MTAAVVWTPPPGFAALGTLPIRLRAGDGEVIASGVSGRALAVPPGRYFLCVTLPNGREVIGGAALDVGEGGTPPPPPLEREMARGFDMATLIPAAEGATVAANRWDGALADMWSGDQFALEPGEAVELGGVARAVPHGGRADALLLLPTAAGRIAHVLPYDRPLAPDAGGDAAMLAALAPTGDRLVLRSPLGGGANALFLYVGNGLNAESRRLARALVEDAAPPVSMLQAVLALHVLLRANDLATVDPMLGRLLALAPDMPDTHAVHAEIRARQGRHEEAVAALRTGCALGCPWFRPGASYLLERLRLYLEIDEGPSTFSLLPDDRDRARAWKAGLERVALRLDPSALFTTFRLDPAAGS